MRHSGRVVVLLAALAIAPLACKAPAEFEVVGLDVTPPEVYAGDTVAVSAKIQNTGGSEGIYTATLTVDGADVDSRQVAAAPGATETVAFSLVTDKAGTYQLAVGNLNSSVTVKKLVTEEVELAYDDGQARDCLSVGPPYADGYLVDFDAPSVRYYIEKVRIYGIVYGSGWEGKDFDVEIWDQDRKVLHSATYPVTRFPVENPAWVEVEIPDIEVSGGFYVHMHTGTGRLQGIHIGADDSVVNKHSETTIRTAEGTTEIVAVWPYRRDLWVGDKTNVNWMIRVVGTAMVPEE